MSTTDPSATAILAARAKYVDQMTYMFGVEITSAMLATPGFSDALDALAKVDCKTAPSVGELTVTQAGTLAALIGAFTSGFIVRLSGDSTRQFPEHIREKVLSVVIFG